MARLPRFQESGLISADVPRLDFANVRETSALSQSVTSALDKISQFAFGKVREEKEQRNQILGVQMRGEYEAEAQRRLAELNVLVQTGQLTDFGQIQEEVRALSGLATGLAQVSPQQAQGLMTSIQAGGKALLAKASDTLTKAYAIDSDQRTDNTIADLQRNLETLYEVADSPETIAQYEAGVRGIAFAVAAKNPDSMQAKMQDFEKARVVARNNALSNFMASPAFAASPSERLTKIRSGDLGRYTPIWKSLPQQDKDKIVDGINKRLADEYTLLDRENKLNESLNSQANLNDYNEFYLGRIGGDELLLRMRQRNYVPSREELKAIRSGDVPGAPDNYFGGLEWQARQGTLTANSANDLFVQGRISLRQRNGLLTLIDKTDRPEVARAKDYIANSFVPNPLDPTTRKGNVRKAEVTNQLLVEMEQARAEGKPFDSFKRAQELVNTRKTAEDAVALQQARDKLAELLAANKITYSEELTAAQLRELDVNQNVAKQILRQINVIRQEK